MNYTTIFHCSVCGEENEIFIEPEDGAKQTLTIDCEVCCRPNVVRMRIVDDEVVVIETEFEG